MPDDQAFTNKFQLHHYFGDELPFYSTEIWGNLKFGSETLLKRPRAVAALRGQLKLKQNQATFLIAYGGKPALASGLNYSKL